MVLLRPPRLNGRSPLTLCSQLRPGLRRERRPHPSTAVTARNFGAYDAFCGPGWALLEALHGAGLSWALAIPTAAIFVRLAIVYPLMYAPARKATLRATDARAHVQAFESITKALSRKKMMQEGPEASKKYAQTQLQSYTSEIKERWKFGLARQTQPFLSLPIFLAFAETIRRMIGTDKGIMGLAIGPSEDVQASSAPEGVEAAVVEDTSSASSSVSDSADLSSWVEPSMATEGMLWFSDLTVADPTLVLPVLVSSATFFAVWRGSRVLPGEEEGKNARVLRRTLLSGSVIIFPFILKVPAGMLLYWVTSTTCAGLTHVWNDYYYKKKTSIKPVRKLMPFKAVTERIRS
ncbi:60Kd inner membrane protein-domain-containing protein [Phyllosticta citrichinensis]